MLNEALLHALTPAAHVASFLQYIGQRGAVWVLAAVAVILFVLGARWVRRAPLRVALLWPPIASLLLSTVALQVYPLAEHHPLDQPAQYFRGPAYEYALGSILAFALLFGVVAVVIHMTALDNRSSLAWRFAIFLVYLPAMLTVLGVIGLYFLLFEGHGNFH